MKTFRLMFAIEHILAAENQDSANNNAEEWLEKTFGPDIFNHIYISTISEV